MKKFTLIVVMLLLFGNAFAQTTLTAGDIAFIGYNTDINGTEDHSFSWITLEDLSAGTVIYFTEEGWNANGNSWYGSTSEGHYSWTASSATPAGTKVYVYEDGSTNTLISSEGSMSGILSGTSWNLSAGDNIFAYQSTTGVKPNAPTFLSGLLGDDNFAHTAGCDDANNWFDCENCTTSGQSCATTGTGTSGLPSTLTNGTNAIALFPIPFNETDNAKYNGTLTGTKTFIASEVNNRSNWIYDNDTAYNITSGEFATPSITTDNNALYFDTDAKVSGLDGPNPTNFTVELNIYLDQLAPGGDWQGVYYNSSDDTGFFVDDQNRLVLYVTQAAHYRFETAFNLESWTHVAFTYNNATNTVAGYLDGQVVSVTSQDNASSATMTLPTSNVTMGYGPGNFGDYSLFTGALDDFRIWDVVKTPSEIDANNDSELADAGDANLLRYYDFNQGLGGQANAAETSLIDRTGNSSGGSLANFALSGDVSNWVAFSSLGGSATPTVATSAATSVSATETTLNGEVTSDGGASITERGFVYALSSNDPTPTVAEVDGTTVFKQTSSGTTGAFNETASGLSASSGYSYVAYAENSIGITEGSVESFTTESAGVLLSSSPTLIFTENSTDITGDNLAQDGEGGSQSISDIDIQVFNISNTDGTFLNSLSWKDNNWLASNDAEYSAITFDNNDGNKGMSIKSADGSEFRLVQFLYYNWGESSAFTNTIKGFRDGIEVSSMTFDGFDSDYDPITVSLDASFSNVDDVRIYISAGGYVGDQSATNHSINNIQVESPVSTVPSGNLLTGDIALIGINSDSSPDELSFVALEEISAGETIYISDYGWDGVAFSTTSSGAEGAITWTITSPIPAGTVLHLTIQSPAGTPVISGDISTYGTVSATGWTVSSSPVASGGDNWFIYQGTSPTSVPSTWIFGFANFSTDVGGTVSAGEWLPSGSPSSTTSLLPTTLTLGTTAVGLTTTTYHADNMVYAGTRVGDKASLLTSIGTRSNWNGDESVTQDISPGGTNFPGTNPIFTLGTPTAPTVSTSSASSVTATTAILNGEVTVDGGATISERGFVYALTSDDGTPTLGEVDGTTVFKQTSSGTTGSFNEVVSGLSPSSSYTYVAYATNSAGTTEGSVQTFTTDAPTYLFDFESATASYSGWDTKTLTIDDNTLSLSFTVQAKADKVLKGSESGWAFNGSEGLYFGYDYLETQMDFEIETGHSFDLKGFYISHQGDAGSNPTDYTVFSDKGSITINPPLDQSGSLTYIDVVGNGNSAYFQGISSFSVQAPGSGAYFEIDDITIANIQSAITTPSITTSTATSITSIEATLNGEVTADGGASITERGFVYSTSSNPTTSDNKVIVGSGTGTFAQSVTGLTLNTTYYVKAYAINSEGTSYGSVEQFTTVNNAIGEYSAGTNTLPDTQFFGLQFTTPNTDPAYSMTGFTFLDNTGSNPVGAGKIYVFTSSPSGLLTPSDLPTYTVDLLGISDTWNGGVYGFSGGLALEANTTYWVLTDTDGFEVGNDFSNPNNAIYATGTGNNYVNQLQTINYQVTGIAVDAPTLSSSSPTDNATGIATNSDITLTFSEDIAFGTGNIEVIDLTDGSNSFTIDAANTGTEASINGTVLTINPNADLDDSSSYSVRIATTAIEDTSGNSYTGITDDITLNFDTADETNPTFNAVSSTPTDNAVGVSVTENIVLTFSENVTLGTSGYISIENLDDMMSAPIQFYVATDSDGTTTNPGAGKIGVVDNKIYLNPTTNLAEQTDYNINIQATAIDDTSGNSFAGFGGVGTYNFTTGDFTGPTLSSSSPTDNATGIATNSNITLTFSEAIAFGTGNIEVIDLTDGSNSFTIDAANPGSDASISGTVLTINPNADLDDSSSYSVRIATTAIEDVSGNSYAGITDDTTLNFNTVDVTAPTVTSVAVPSSANYIEGEDLDFTINFSEDVTVNSGGGTPQVSLTIGSTTRQAIYQSGTGTNELLFRYTVQAGESDSDGITIGTFSANGGTLSDGASNDADLTLNGVGATTNILVDAVSTVLKIDPASYTGTISLSDNRFVSINMAPLCLDVNLTYIGVEVDAASAGGGNIILGIYDGSDLIYQTNPLSITGGVDESVGELIPPGHPRIK